MQKPIKSFTPEQRQEYEKLRFTVHVHNESAKKWAATLMEIKTKEYYLIDSSTWDDWVKKNCPWSVDTVRIAMKEAEDERLIATTTGEPIISRGHKSETNVSAPSPSRRGIHSEAKLIPPNEKTGTTATDATGYPVHPTLLPLWNRREELTPLLTAVSKLKCSITDARMEGDELFMGIDQDAIIKLDSVYSLIDAARLDYVCGVCQGTCKVTEQSCPSCKNTGLMTKYQWTIGVMTTIKEQRRKQAERRSHAPS